MNKALENLVFLGYTEKDITLYGKVWKLRVLTSEENLETMKDMKEYDEMLARTYAFKIQTLGRAIKEVDGIIIDSEKEGLEFIKKLQAPIVNKLYDEYSIMFDEQNKVLTDKDEIKN